MKRREFTGTVIAVAAMPETLLFDAPWRVWLLNDCDYIAARSLPEALAWYLNWTGVDAGNDPHCEPEEADLGETFWTDENRKDLQTTFAAAIAEETADGSTEPFYLATHGHYC